MALRCTGPEIQETQGDGGIDAPFRLERARCHWRHCGHEVSGAGPYCTHHNLVLAGVKNGAARERRRHGWA
jgi:hypothetical protein